MEKQDGEGPVRTPESRESSFTGPRVLLEAPKRVRRCQRKQAALGLKSYLKAQGVGFETLEDLQKRGWSRKTVHVRLDWCSMSIYGLNHLYPADRVTEAERSPEVQEEILRALESRGPAGKPAGKPAGERQGKQDAPETGKTPGAKRGAARGPAAPDNPALPRREWENKVITERHRRMFPGMDDYQIRDMLAERMDPGYRPPDGKRPGPDEKPGDGKRKAPPADDRFQGDFAKMASGRPEGGGPLWNRGGRE